MEMQFAKSLCECARKPSLHGIGKNNKIIIHNLDGINVLFADLVCRNCMSNLCNPKRTFNEFAK